MAGPGVSIVVPDAAPPPAMIDSDLAEMLRRCPPATHAAAQAFRHTQDPQYLPPILLGVIERYVEPELKPLLPHADDGLRLAEDLGIDSLTLMQIAVLIEDVLAVTTSDDELRQLRTIGDIKCFARRCLAQKGASPDRIGLS